MSPAYMAAKSHCSPTCASCIAARTKQTFWLGTVLALVSVAAIVLSFPVDALAGVALAAGGICGSWNAAWILRQGADLKRPAFTALDRALGSGLAGTGIPLALAVIDGDWGQGIPLGVAALVFATAGFAVEQVWGR